MDPEPRFPDGFLWGAATSAHQVEGGNRQNDWSAFEEAGRVTRRSGDACLHYERFEDDFDLAAAGGHDAHRFSIEWSRVEPAEDVWSDEALSHYRRVVGALRARGLKPIVTLHHFTNPLWFARRGGWERRDAPARFARYVERIVEALPDVRWWITINEPTVYVKRGFVDGVWPPGRAREPAAALRALRRMCRAHVRAYGTIHRRIPGARVGWAHSAALIEPCRGDRAGDRAVARARDELLNVLPFRLISRRPWGRPRPRLDFVGLNYYTRSVVHRERFGPGALVGVECDGHVPRGPRSDLGWEIHPEGLLATLRRFARFGRPLMITENGIATRDEALRAEFLRAHLDVLGRAVAAGLDVIGYLHWSLIDNYEWSHGRGPRFGLVGVDYETQRRTPRPAYDLFERFTRNARAAAGARPGTAA